jgi:transposase
MVELSMPKTFQLGRPELWPQVQQLLRKGGSQRQMERLTAVRMAMEGKHTLEQMAQAVGRARSRISEWMRIVRQHGVDELLGRHQGRGRVAQVKGKALTGLRHGLRRGRWKRSQDAGQWLKQRHGIDLSESGVRYWLNKAQES